MTTMVLNAMDSPLEALAFDYLNFGLLTVVNNFWTWIAVIMAAISFWRLKAVPKSTPDFLSPAAPSPPLPPPTPVKDEETLLTPPPSPASELFNSLLNGETKKTKFTLQLHYKDDAGKTAEEEEDEEEDAEEWWKRWEEALRTRRGEKGWYRCQNWTKLNGNVVRLWELRDHPISSSTSDA